MLADAGLSKADAQAMVSAYLAQAAASGGGGSSGGDGSRRSERSSTPIETEPQGVDDATYKYIRNTVVLTARYKGDAEAVKILQKYADQLSTAQLNYIYAYIS